MHFQAQRASETMSSRSQTGIWAHCLEMYQKCLTLHKSTKHSKSAGNSNSSNSFLHFLFRKPISDYLWYTRIELIFHTRFFLSVSIQFGRDFRDRIGVTISLFRKGVRFKEVQYTFFAFFLCFCSSRVIGRFFPLLAFTSVYFPLRWPLVLFWWHF